MHIGLLSRHQVQQSQNPAESLVVDHQHGKQSGHCEWSSNFSPKDAEKEEVRERHSNVGHIAVVELDHCHILEEVFPQRHALLHQSLGHHLSVHERPRVVHTSSVDTRHEGTCQDVQQYAFQHDNADDPQALEVFELGCFLRVHLAWLDQQTERIPQQPRVQGSSHPEMGRQAIRTHPGPTLVLRFLIKATLDHPPSNGPLESSQTQQGNQPIPHLGLQVPLILEDGKWNGEPIAEHHAHLPMEELHPIDGLKSLQSDLLIDCLVLDGLLVLVELDIPFLRVAGVPLCVGTPVCHAESRMSQSCIPAQHDHAEHSRCRQEEPRPYQPLLTRLDQGGGEGETRG